ncbi:hypothetical protein [Streptomyces sp. NPDC001792]|uniref:hypothetical protein n=1 Tax=unclassified Streptomyces TaxID=2593676 RepID=UPI00332E6E2E
MHPPHRQSPAQRHRAAALQRPPSAPTPLLAYTGCLGHTTQLTHAVPETLPAGEDGRRYLDSVLDTLMTGAPES